MEQFTNSAIYDNISLGEWNPDYLSCIKDYNFLILILSISYGVIFPASLLGNGYVIVHFFLHRKSSSTSKGLMANLAMLDFLLALSLPLVIVYHSKGNNWLFGNFFCYVSSSLFYGNLYGSNLFFTTICLERYTAVCHPFIYQRVKTPAICKTICCSIWLIIIMGIIFICTKVQVVTRQPNGTITCGDTFSEKAWSDLLTPLIIILSVMCFFVPYVFVLSCYSLIVLKLRYLDSNIRSQVPKKKCMQAILSVFVVMTICYLPFHTFQMVNAFHRLHSAHIQGASFIICVGQRISVCLASLNSFLDPFVYYFLCDSFKWAYSCLGMDKDSKTTISKETAEIKL
ncbi:lysophosphatidic acid receptor 6-like [Erpetoichthys calabaricus]|uniref:lysophosphatidic acid receptor 6-like n=1 Tax=Erpetoichthys calabaricus TaxID=27687 RepID=UPI00109F29EA|nr:lysophosphatidic acid receptor 6-like [Erpetoichthys calabaricus]